MTDECDEFGRSALMVLRRRMGPIFKELEQQLDAVSGEIPDENTFVVPVLLTAILHAHKGGVELIGTSIAAPSGLPEDGISTVISEALDQMQDNDCETMTVLDDGTSIRKKDIQ